MTQDNHGPLEPLAINLNATVRVTLTPAGMRWLKEVYANLGALLLYRPDDNPREFCLWEIMKIFGPQMYNGNPDVPFEDNQIILLPTGEVYRSLVRRVEADTHLIS